MDGRARDRKIAEHFGRNLCEARRRADLSQEELARLTSLHRTEISLIERGGRLPRVDTLLKLAGALAVGADELLQGIEWSAPASGASGSFTVERGA